MIVSGTPPRSRRRSLVMCKFCASADSIRNGTRKGIQYWQCKRCGRGFVDNGALPRKKYATDAMAIAVYAYFNGSSLSEIRDSLERKTGTRPTRSTVYDWIAQIKKMGIDESKRHRPKPGETWKLSDEIRLTIEGRSYHLLDLVDCASQFVIATRISRTAGEEDIRLLLESARERTGLLPARIVTDRPWKACPSVMAVSHAGETGYVEFGLAMSEHDSNASCDWHRALHDTVELQVFRSAASAARILEGRLFTHNFLFRPESLGYRSPAEAAGIEFPYRTWKQMVHSLGAGVTTTGDLSKMHSLRAGELRYRQRKQAAQESTLVEASLRARPQE